jgi:hypothetical protein
MADITVDGTTRVAYVPAIANNAAPTTAELNAGILLQSILTLDGLMGFEADTQPVDTTSLASTFNTKNIGRDDFSNTALQLKKQASGDTAYTTLVRGTAGYIVVRRYIAESTAWASSQAVEVYPIICGQTKYVTPAANEVAKYQVPVFISLPPTLRASIA